jgi:hypothetical protein
MDIDRRENVVRLAITIVTRGHIAEWQGNTRKLCMGLAVIGGLRGLRKREVQALFLWAMSVMWLIQTEMKRRGIHVR